MMDLTGRFPLSLKKNTYQVVSSAAVFMDCQATLPLCLGERYVTSQKTAAEDSGDDQKAGDERDSMARF